MFYRSRSPLRISFAGGGTDVLPYAADYGGFVLNAAINRYAYTSIEICEQNYIEVYSHDYDSISRFHWSDIEFDGSADLAKGVIKRLHKQDYGLSVTTRNDAPPGSGLGSSSAMVVSLIGAFKEIQNKPMSEYDIAKMAYEIERHDLKIMGGMQDQYASAFGGFNFMEFDGENVLVNRLRVDPWMIRELEYNLLLVYTRKSRLSSNIIESQVDNVKQKNEKSLQAMHALKEHAQEMKRALLTGDATGFGKLLDYAWQEKKKMAAAITNPMIDELYSEAIKAGALGGKVSGAGGGGFMMFYCDSGKKQAVAKRLTELGAETMDFQFEMSGLETWRSCRTNPTEASTSDMTPNTTAVG